MATPGRRVRICLLSLGLTVAFVYNYTTDFKKTVMNEAEGTWSSLGAYLLFYGLPYFVSLYFWTRGRESARHAKSPRFLTVALLGILVLALNRAAIVWSVRWVTEAVTDPAVSSYLGFTVVSLTRLASLALPLLLVRRFVDTGRNDLYGINRREFRFRPYAVLLALMAIPIAAVAFLPSFQQTYPIYRPGFVEDATGWPVWLTWPIHEITYALRFVSVEFYFRGFLVLGIARYLGRDAIIPQVILYSIWHFGKPMPEALGSVFGGLILAVLALETGSIWGGILIHMGVALLMNLAAVAAGSLLG